MRRNGKLEALFASQLAVKKAKQNEFGKGEIYPNPPTMF